MLLKDALLRFCLFLIDLLLVRDLAFNSQLCYLASGMHEHCFPWWCEIILLSLQLEPSMQTIDFYHFYAMLAFIFAVNNAH